MMEATESPLDVLSRAATMVQDSSPPDYDDERGCGTKELPTARWRRERRYREKLGDYTKLQQNKTNIDSTTYDTPTTPPLPDVLGARTHTSTTGDTPLDMTVTRGSKPPPSYSQSVGSYRSAPARPSVITCAPPAPTAWSEPSSDSKGTNKEENGRQGHRRELLSGMCDPVIDEHFRRSLGKDYMSLFSSDSTTNNNNSSNSSNGNSSVTVTGLSVDDHFAKALGETWVKLQGQNCNSSPSKTLSAKDKKTSTPSTATVSVSVKKENSSNSNPTATAPATSLLQQRRGLVSI